MKEASKKSNLLRLAAGALCLCVTLGCLVYLGDYFLKIKRSQDNVSQLRERMITKEDTSGDSSASTEELPPYQEVNGRMVQTKFADLYAENPDFIGWLTIPDTKVDYPVMQNASDNEYYIHRNFQKEWDGSGLPFLDLQCSYTEPTANQIIYGHNMKSGTMFAGLLSYKSEKFYEEHKTITFDTIDADGTYEVIAAFPSQIYSEDDTTHFKYYEFFDADSQAEFDNYVQQVKALTPYDIDATAEYGDTLITLSTCAYHAEEGRFAVVAKKVQE